MRIRALCSFSGSIAMCKGQVRECSNEAVLLDLLRAGYVEEVKEKMKTEESETAETTRKPRKKAVKAVEDQ